MKVQSLPIFPQRKKGKEKWKEKKISLEMVPFGGKSNLHPSVKSGAWLMVKRLTQRIKVLQEGR